MSKAISRVENLIVTRSKQIKSVLPATIGYERFCRMLVNATHTNPALLECTPESFEIAMLNCAALGLEPNSPLHQAVIVPRKRKGRQEATLQVEYAGLIQLARNSGEVEDFGADWVCESDEFSYEKGKNSYLKHKPARGKRGNITEFYAYASLVRGGFPFVVMSREEVERHRDKYSDSYRWAESGDSSKGGGKKDSTWHTEFARMGRKTAIRQLWPFLPRAVAPVFAMERSYEEGNKPRLAAAGKGIVLDEDVVDVEPVSVPESEIEEMIEAATHDPDGDGESRDGGDR